MLPVPPRLVGFLEPDERVLWVEERKVRQWRALLVALPVVALALVALRS